MGRKILVIDVDSGVTDGICGPLESAGHEVIVEACSDLPHEALQRELPDLAIVNGGLQHEEAFELCRSLKSTELGRSTPVILFSRMGKTELNDLPEFEPDGYDQCVAKTALSDQKLLGVCEYWLHSKTGPADETDLSSSDATRGAFSVDNAEVASALSDLDSFFDDVADGPGSVDQADPSSLSESLDQLARVDAEEIADRRQAAGLSCATGESVLPSISPAPDSGQDIEAHLDTIFDTEGQDGGAADDGAQVLEELSFPNAPPAIGDIEQTKFIDIQDTARGYVEDPVVLEHDQPADVAQTPPVLRSEEPVAVAEPGEAIPSFNQPTLGLARDASDVTTVASGSSHGRLLSVAALVLVGAAVGLFFMLRDDSASTPAAGNIVDTPSQSTTPITPSLPVETDGEAEWMVTDVAQATGGAGDAEATIGTPGLPQVDPADSLPADSSPADRPKPAEVLAATPPAKDPRTAPEEPAAEPPTATRAFATRDPVASRVAAPIEADPQAAALPSESATGTVIAPAPPTESIPAKVVEQSPDPVETAGPSIGPSSDPIETGNADTRFPVDPVEASPVVPEPSPIADTTLPPKPAPASTGFVPPKVVQRTEPTFPKASKKISGVIMLKVLVSESGKISKVVVEEGIPGGGEYESVAIYTVLNWKYRSATYDGVPVESWARERFEISP